MKNEVWRVESRKNYRFQKAPWDENVDEEIEIDITD